MFDRFIPAQFLNHNMWLPFLAKKMSEVFYEDAILQVDEIMALVGDYIGYLQLHNQSSGVNEITTSLEQNRYNQNIIQLSITIPF